MITLRLYCDTDEAALIALWQHSWSRAYPHIDFAARLEWWTTRWREELVAQATVVVAEQDGPAIGFVTIDKTGYLDQLVVAPEFWGSQAATLLVDEARRLSPAGITLLVNSDNARAIRFYTRAGFVTIGHDVNPVSGRPVLRLAWTP
ncbi:MAG: GNAT family N-acetyltransferase [Alphaproteobacteria bacterium]|nr:GNAT family N-acetyltransferase [Alphaproteobacteria bacterium]